MKIKHIIMQIVTILFYILMTLGIIGIILKITNHRTKISKRELKIFLDKYANDHWNVATSEGNNTIFYTNRLTLRMSDDCISLGEE